MTLLTVAPMSHAQEAKEPKADKKRVVVIPVRAGIDKPALYVLRRGLKDAISDKADTVVIDMETPGGRLDVTFDILQAIEKFPGKTVTYINREATSAGAIISAGTDEIWMHPKSTIGAASPVTGSGGDIDKTMKGKIMSYLKARIRVITEGKGHRGKVISAMVDGEEEVWIGDKVVGSQKEGEPLSLTATEATELYGDPAMPLLAKGTAESIEDLLDQIHGEGNYTIERVELSWSEDLAQFITALTPALLAFGLLGLFIEFKTPGFGVFGIGGLILLTIVFFGHQVAGLSGYEPMLMLLLGIILIGVEIFILPGTVVPAVTGGILVVGSLFWAMLDIWPDQPLEINNDLLMRPLLNITIGAAGAVVLFIALLRFLPGDGPWGNMILRTAIAGEPGGIHAINSTAEERKQGGQASLVGSKAIAATDLYPSGQVSIDGKRYEARLEIGTVDAGAELVVTGAAGFGLIVEKVKSNGEAKS